MRQCMGAQQRRAIISGTLPLRVSNIITPARVIQKAPHVARKINWSTLSRG